MLPPLSDAASAPRSTRYTTDLLNTQSQRRRGLFLLYGTTAKLALDGAVRHSASAVSMITAGVGGDTRPTSPATCETDPIDCSVFVDVTSATEAAPLLAAVKLAPPAGDSLMSLTASALVSVTVFAIGVMAGAAAYSGASAWLLGRSG